MTWGVSSDHPATGEARKECRQRKIEAGEIEANAGPSQNPHTIRARARRHMEKAEADLAQLPRKPVEKWDWEELARGYPRNVNGKFGGRPPKWVTRAMYDEAVRRFQHMLNAKVRVVTAPAVEVLTQVMQDEETPPATQAQIAEYLLDRVLGKPTTPIDSNVELNLADMLAQWVAHPGEDPDDPRIVDAEVVDDDDVPSEGPQPTFPELTVRRPHDPEDPPRGY